MPGVNAPAMRLDGAAVDLGPRVYHTATVAASPSAATITIVASLTVTTSADFSRGVLLLASAGVTVGTNGVSLLWQIRKTDASGTVVGSTGAVTAVAAELRFASLNGLDTTPTLPGQVYVLCLTVASGSAASTVTPVSLTAIVI